MPPKPRWLLAIPDAISQLEKLDRTLLTRRDIERLFGVSTARAATLMQTFGAEMTGHQRTLQGSVSELAWRPFAWFMSEPEHIVVLHRGSAARQVRLSELMKG